MLQSWPLTPETQQSNNERKACFYTGNIKFFRWVMFCLSLCAVCCVDVDPDLRRCLFQRAHNSYSGWGNTRTRALIRNCHFCKVMFSDPWVHVKIRSGGCWHFCRWLHLVVISRMQKPAHYLILLLTVWFKIHFIISFLTRRNIFSFFLRSDWSV